jgi:hypothetical protein
MGSSVVISRERGMIAVTAKHGYSSELNVIREALSAYGDYRAIRVSDHLIPQLIEQLILLCDGIEDPLNILGLPPFDDGEYGDRDLAELVAQVADYGVVHNGNHYDTAVVARRKQLWTQAESLLRDVGISYKEETRYNALTVIMSQTSNGQRMVEAVAERINAEITATYGNSGLVEEISVDTLIDIWERARVAQFGVKPTKLGERAYPNKNVALSYIAVAIASAQGPPVEVVDGVLRRVYNAWPMSCATEPSEMHVEGAHISLASWAVLTQSSVGGENYVLMHLSAVNTYGKNKATWASIMDGTRATYQLSFPYGSRAGYGGRSQSAKRQTGKKRYITDWNDQPMKKSRMTHMAITHYTMENPESGQGFLHLVGDHISAAPDLSWFFIQIDKALTIPVQETWAKALWDMGVQLRLIHRMPSHNCAAYWVDASENKWTKIVQALTLGRTLEDLGDVEVETVGGIVADADQLVLEDVETEEDYTGEDD